MVILPGVGRYSFITKQDTLVENIFKDEFTFDVDQVASFLVAEDSSVQLIDLRPELEFAEFNIPGSFNIPFSHFFSTKPETWLHNSSIKYIFYSDSDIYSNQALALAHGLGYSNCYVMNGGLNTWFELIMNSSFSGERITARQNRLFETRSRAKRFFTEINSLPDSLKIKYAESRRQAERDLDGGCE